MATKKKVTKKKAVKKSVKKVEEAPIVIDENSGEIDDGTIIAALQSLKEHPGWKIIKKILDENVFQQEKKILNDIFEKDLKYNDEDLEKQIRRVYISIAKLPDNEIDRLTGKEVPEDEYDPYYKK
jgi:hypothetical protein